jgi:hypothetical protein
MRYHTGVLKWAVLLGFGFTAGLVALLLTRPAPIHMDTPAHSALFPTSPDSALTGLAAQIRAGPITIRRPTIVLVVAGLDSSLTLSLIDSVRLVAETEGFAFFLRGHAAFQILDPAAGLSLGPPDAPFPSTMIVVAPGSTPVVGPARLSPAALRDMLRQYRRRPDPSPVRPASRRVPANYRMKLPRLGHRSSQGRSHQTAACSVARARLGLQLMRGR